MGGVNLELPRWWRMGVLPLVVEDLGCGQSSLEGAMLILSWGRCSGSYRCRDNQHHLWQLGGHPGEASSPPPPPTQPGLPEPGASCGPEPTSWPCSCHHPIRSNCILPAANPGGADVLEGYCQRQAPWREAGREEGDPLPHLPVAGGGEAISHLRAHRPRRDSWLGAQSLVPASRTGPWPVWTLSKHPTCTGRR